MSEEFIPMGEQRKKDLINKRNYIKLQLEERHAAAAESTRIAQQESLRMAKQDSARKAEELKRKELNDRLKTYATLDDQKLLDSQYVDEEPISAQFLKPGNKEEILNSLDILTKEMITHEAATNVNDELREYESLREDLMNIHSKFQNAQISDHKLMTRLNIIDNPEILRVEHYFRGANSIDRAWPSHYGKTEPKTLWHDLPGLTGGGVDLEFESSMWKENKHHFESATVARLVASNQDIIDTILGTSLLNEQTNKYEITPGFIDILKEYNLVGETETWEWMKESFGYRSNAMRLLDTALKAKKAGRDYFLQPIGFFNEDSWNISGPSREFGERISPYPEEQQQMLLETLQNMVDSIYNKGVEIEKGSMVMLNRFKDLQKKFPGRETYYTDGDTPFKNKDLVKAKEIKNNLTNLVDWYKYSTGEDYDLMSSLNQIAMEQLNYEIDSLPDKYRTEALDEWLIAFGDELQKSTTGPNPDAAKVNY